MKRAISFMGQHAAAGVSGVLEVLQPMCGSGQAAMAAETMRPDIEAPVADPPVGDGRPDPGPPPGSGQPQK